MDRIERHDFVNAVLLAVVLLGMAFALVAATRALFDTVDEGLVDAESAEETVPTTATPPTTDGEAATEAPASTTTPPKPPSEVQVRVGNGALKSGVAGRGTEILANAGYATLGPKNSDIKLETTTVYYLEGFGADAEVVANLLSVPIANIAPMPPDTGISQDTATIIVILGSDTTL